MIALSFEIPDDLYRRAITQPLTPPPSRAVVVGRNLLAAVLAPTALVLLCLALFDAGDLAPFTMGAAIGATFVMAVWWRQHRKLVALHNSYNETGGRQKMSFSADEITVARPHVQSRIEWPFVRAIRAIDGASLIELPTARLIVPDTALTDHSPAQFRAKLEAWRATP